MVRRTSLLAQVSVLGALVALALPSSSSALAAQFVYLTPAGPSPTTLSIQAGSYPVWMNQDSVAHTVTFATTCTVEVGPGASGQCPNGPWRIVGDYPYTVDGTTQASVNVTPAWRSVTLEANRHGFRRGSEVLLHGSLTIASSLPPGTSGPRMPVRVFALPHGHHLWYRIAVVTARPPRGDGSHSVWHLRVRPHGDTTYRVEVNTQPEAGRMWLLAWSKPFGLYVRDR